jgi:hypothetical protein
MVHFYSIFHSIVWLHGSASNHEPIPPPLSSVEHPHPTGSGHQMLLWPGITILPVAWFHAKAYGDACNSSRIGASLQLLGAAAAGHAFPEAHGLAHPVTQAHEPVYFLLAECSCLMCACKQKSLLGY